MKAYSFDIKKQDYDLIRRIAAVIHHPTASKINIYDLRSYNYEPNENDLVFIFGSKAEKVSLSTQIKVRKIILPELCKLHKKNGCETKERIYTFKKLKEIKSNLDSNKNNVFIDSIPTDSSQLNTINEDQLPNLTALEVSSLEKTLLSKNILGYKTFTTSGKSIYVSSTNTDPNCDINITFSELYAVKTLMEALNVKELQIVKDNNSSIN